MLFSDIITLNEIIATTIRFDGALFRDDHDPEVDRFLNSSPPMNEQILQTSYEYETLKYGAANLTLLHNQSSKGQTQKMEKSFVYEDSVIPQQAHIDSNKINQPVNTAEEAMKDVDTVEPSSSSNNNPLSSPPETNNLFTPSKVPKRSDLSKIKSALTMNLNTANTAALTSSFSPTNSSSSSSSHHTPFILPTGPSAAAGNIGKLKLTIYLPDCTPMTIMASDADNFDIVLKRVLKQHAEENKTPSLLYNQPEMYELRMHEGDGEPDRDFPALDRSKLLKLFNEKEYCLCQKEASKVNAASAATITAANLIAAATANSAKRVVPNDGDHSPFRRSSAPVALDTEIIITIIIPNVGAVRLPLEDGENNNKCFRDILPDIRDDLEVRGHKLRLCTDEFVFVVPPDEQARLKMLSPYLTLNTQIAPLGIRKFELQKRVFADSVRTQRISTANRPQRKLSMQQSTLYTDTLANVYQEWNVKKKTKYGGLQDRVIGIDGKMVYNSKRDKRGGLTGTSSGSVARAQRSLNTIKSVDVMDHDKRALKISWEEDGVLHDVEYTCESVKDCTDILEKLKYLLAKKKIAAGGSGAVQLH